MSLPLENVAQDYSKYCDVDLNGKLQPINKSIEDMLARLEEFQTMVSFVKQDETDSNDILTSLPNYRNDLEDMFNKIDTMESLVIHMKNNLDKLEDDIEKAETELGCNDPKKKVTSIFTPLFRKNTEKKQPTPSLGLFKVEDYFEQQNS
ncbi:biogenesis of lysosome-related organelles complex 1 subunit 4 [Anoplophora glabripennis]|uniref:biogenesis of lysosome-related organelles complex 1 subunit 4 n=1 Tax=Anoplophora glabripennis TaxID=217634 RepID=UPI0008741E31|nr:biogenesis of lysosome-related organelles complex 1 subunit 4 [Anoplophora glabripennis]